jgi:hypothetical protein
MVDEQLSRYTSIILNNINFLFLRFNSFFNWTMTYRLDSDIPEPYGYLESRYFYCSGETVPLKDSLTGR